MVEQLLQEPRRRHSTAISATLETRAGPVVPASHASLSLSRLATISGDLEWCIAPSFPLICTLSLSLLPRLLRLFPHGILIYETCETRYTQNSMFGIGSVYEIDCKTNAKCPVET